MGTTEGVDVWTVWLLLAVFSGAIVYSIVHVTIRDRRSGGGAPADHRDGDAQMHANLAHLTRMSGGGGAG